MVKFWKGKKMENLDQELLKEEEKTTDSAEIIDEVDETAKLIEEKDNLIKEYLDKYQRTLAEFDNFRKRTQKEKASMHDDGVRETVEKLLPIIDNLERALSSSNNKEDSFYKGVEMIFRQFEGLFDYLDIKQIEAVGEKFDPSIHNAVAHVEDENYSESEVIEELQKGYTFKDKVIRFSMVKVAN